MNLAFDCETVGLSGNFRLGVLQRNGKQPEVFTNKEAMWNRIIEIGQKESKNKKHVYAYAHNVEFDLAKIANWKDPNLEIYSHKPFLASYKLSDKWGDRIQFIDTMMLYPGKLSQIAQLLQTKKMDLEEELYEKKHLNFEEHAKMIQYCKQDVAIVLQGVNRIREQLKQDEINVRKILTTGLLAINYFTQHVRKQHYASCILAENMQATNWKEKKIGHFYECINGKHIRKSLIGSRVQAFKTGEQTGLNYLDCNSLYPFATTKSKFPILSTESTIENPLRIYDKKEILDMYGCSTVLIEKPKDKYGYVPTRTEKNRYYPKQKCTLVGTYVNSELKYFEKQGAKIKDIRETTKWATLPENPLAQLMKQLYQKRKQGQFEKVFYKGIMNRLIGKFAQENKEMIEMVDEVSKFGEYEAKGFEVTALRGKHYVYTKKMGIKHPKWYAPIITAETYAKARQILHENMKKIKPKNIVYTDTDSLIFKGKIPKTIKIGKEMGEWKKEMQNANGKFYLKKFYIIGQDIKAAGFKKGSITKKEFEDGKITRQQMLTINTAPTLEDIGKFTWKEINIAQGKDEAEQELKELEYQDLFIDKNENTDWWKHKI